ncbi:2-alkenal reductase (NADP(+)-dependent) [Sphaceloma murrayae]|uniref:2-alkenal reductase (NADP(+)-dependent) n=1 Tax=Sphaceloma murrayae TaxID=2082308 RepID=A0A2K1R2R9_9PEZI|nr:2-alkenal reductase (NADP(+)-dependent) [Sphaceloma murrayae]
MVQNKGLIFKGVPSGLPEAGKHLAVETRDFDTDQAPPSGGATLKINYVSFDPYQRGRLRSAEVKSYSPPFTLGQPLTNRAIATVVKSDNPGFKTGDVVVGEQLNTEEYQVVPKEKLEKDVKQLDNPHNLDPKLFIGALGMPGLTAYSSLYEIGQPKKGEVIFISAASGAVGQLVGQIAKHDGLRVIGSVGDDEKLKFITEELGFEGTNYKKESTADALKRLAPEGIDIYYENVGGETLEAAIAAMKPFGRIVACGMISQYNLPADQYYGVKNLMQVVAKRLTMRGFIVGDANMGPKYFAEHQKTVQKWIHEGTYKPRMSVTKGIDNSIEGLLGLFSGKNFGKAVLEIAPLQ